MTIPKHSGTKNHFQKGGAAYAQNRPTYPPDLTTWLAAEVTDHQLAIDLGCGTGQLSVQLAKHFDRVLALDVSADQIAHAESRPRIDYSCRASESLEASDGPANLVTAAQSAHWFDLTCFYDNLKQALAPEAIVAFISYGVPVCDGAIDPCFQHFYSNDIGPYWPPERRMVEDGYRDLPFPFEEFKAPSMWIERLWLPSQLLGYVETWSATKAARQAERGDIFDQFANTLQAQWGDLKTPRKVTWPINIRAGRYKPSG